MVNDRSGCGKEGAGEGVRARGGYQGCDVGETREVLLGWVCCFGDARELSILVLALAICIVFTVGFVFVIVVIVFIVVIVDIYDQDRTKQLAGHELMAGISRLVYGRMDKVSFAAVICSTDEQFKFRVGFGSVNHARQLIEAGSMNHWSEEAGKSFRTLDLVCVCWITDTEPLRCLDQSVLECWPDRTRNIAARTCTTLLTLKLKRRADGLHHGIAHVCTSMHEVKILPTCLANNARVALVLGLADAVANASTQ